MTCAVRAGSVVAGIDCEVCRERGNDTAQDGTIYTGGGCYQRGVRRSEPYPFEPGHVLHRRIWHCPRSCAIAVGRWFDDFAWLERGVLPLPGGLDAQPAVYVEGMDLIMVETATRDREEMERIKAEAEAHRKGKA